jgi:nitrite reductase/ring-hydroxylating ferredoxin subunit
VLVREKEDCIHALRNACLHAGYRVCEEETGRAQQLYCQYHGWFYALDGLLTEPMLQPKITDRSRFRLARYGMQITNGLIFVDLSKVGPTAPETDAVPIEGLPDDIGQRTPGRRKRYKTTINWKRLRQFAWAAPEMAFGADSCDKVVEYGPLSMIAVRNGDASLIRLIPRYPGQTEIDVIPLPANAGDRGNDKIGDVLRDNNDAIAAAPLDRTFYDWYWPQLAPAAAA